MTSPAERFYTRSYQNHQELNAQWSPKSTEAALAEMGQNQHRYFCVTEYLKTHPGLSVVELGFGTAESAMALASLSQSYRIVDVVARHEGLGIPDNIHFTKADLNDDFPLSDGEFDCTIAMMVVEHLFDPFHSFRELARITKPGGKIFVNLPNIGSIRCRAQLVLGKMPVTSSANWFEKEEWDGNHLHYFTLKDTLRLAKHVGLQPEAHFPVGSQLWLKKISPSLFCHEISYAFSKP